MKKSCLRFFVFIFIAFCFAAPARAGMTVERIKQSGIVRCGVRTTADAFAYRADGEWRGIDVEICRLIASAVLSRSDAVQIVPVNRGEGFPFLAEGKIDVLNAAIPWSMDLEIKSDAAFPAAFYYSSLAFLGHYTPGATSMKAYKGAKVCVNASDPSPFLIRELDTFNKKNDLELRIMKLPSLARAKELLYLKRCDLIFDRLEILHSGYFTKKQSELDLAVLPEYVRPYATGPVIRDDDKEMFKLLKWLVYAVVKAEEKGITSQNIEDFQNTEDREIQTLLERNKAVADRLGVDDAWLYRAIAERGNYDEIYQRGLGTKSVLKIKRTVNRLKKNGGLISAPDFYP